MWFFEFWGPHKTDFLYIFHSLLCWILQYVQDEALSQHGGMPWKSDILWKIFIYYLMFYVHSFVLSGICVISDEILEKHSIWLRWSFRNQIYAKPGDTVECVCVNFDIVDRCHFIHSMKPVGKGNWRILFVYKPMAKM